MELVTANLNASKHRLTVAQRAFGIPKGSAKIEDANHRVAGAILKGKVATEVDHPSTLGKHGATATAVISDGFQHCMVGRQLLGVQLGISPGKVNEVGIGQAFVIKRREVGDSSLLLQLLDVSWVDEVKCSIFCHGNSDSD